MSFSPLISAARKLGAALDAHDFITGTIHFVYNPLIYASEPHEAYLARYGEGRKRCLFLGMNPGPWGMAQTGVPFGEIAAVTGWMGLRGVVGQPTATHPKKPVQGFDCPRSEVSGRRFWGLMKKRYPAAADFFKEHFVANYCPLLFLDEGGRNLTPDKLPKEQRLIINKACDAHLEQTVHALDPEFLVGVGGYAEKKLKDLFGGDRTVCSVLHPSPASPAANRGWEDAAVKQLVKSGVWKG